MKSIERIAAAAAMMLTLGCSTPTPAPASAEAVERAVMDAELHLQAIERRSEPMVGPSADPSRSKGKTT